MGEIGYVRIHRTVWEAYVVSKCGKGAISRTATEVWASITHQRLGGGQFADVYGRSRFWTRGGYQNIWRGRGWTGAGRPVVMQRNLNGL